MLTVDEVRQSLPTHLKPAATQSLADQINQISTDPEVARNIRDNFVSYTTVLKEGRFKTEDYLNAVSYVSFKLMGYNNQEAYKRTFPQRYQGLVAAGRSDKEISAYVSAFNKGKLVNLIYEQTLIPSWVLNQDLFQKAINVQAGLMLDVDVSAKVRTEAANSLMTHLKKPETKQVELSIGVEDTSGMTQLKESLAAMAAQQQDLITQGVSTRDIAHQDLYKKPIDVVEATAKDVTPPAPTAAPKAAPDAVSPGSAPAASAIVEPVTPHHTAPKQPADTEDEAGPTPPAPEESPKTNLGANPLTSFRPS